MAEPAFKNDKEQATAIGTIHSIPKKFDISSMFYAFWDGPKNYTILELLGEYLLFTALRRSARALIANPSATMAVDFGGLNVTDIAEANGYSKSLVRILSESSNHYRPENHYVLPNPFMEKLFDETIKFVISRSEQAICEFIQDWSLRKLDGGPKLIAENMLAHCRSGQKSYHGYKSSAGIFVIIAIFFVICVFIVKKSYRKLTGDDSDKIHEVTILVRERRRQFFISFS